MLAFTKTEVSKPAIIKQLQAHFDADEFVKGLYWENGKGCAVGCTLHNSNHAEYENKFGIPEMLARLEDAIFEGLPNGTAKAWPLRFMKSIKVGTNLSLVGWKFQLWLQIENKKFAEEKKMPEDVIKAINDIIPILKILAKKERLTEKQISAAWSAASTAASTAASAAWSAAWSAESAAWSAAWSAESAAESAESAAWIKMADKLIELIEAA